MKAALVGTDQHTAAWSPDGLSSSEEGKDYIIGALAAREFLGGVGKHYNEPIEMVFEPHMAEQTFHEMLNETKVVQITPMRGFNPQQPLQEPPRQRLRSTAVFGSWLNPTRFLAYAL